MTRAIGRSAALLGVAVLVALGAVVATPEPASAHGVGGIQPSNYETRIVSVRPTVPGLEIRSVDLGNRLEVTNRTGHEVLILGYDGEPYLRVGPRGVFENIRSPATYVNRTLTGGTPVPARADLGRATRLATRRRRTRRTVARPPGALEHGHRPAGRACRTGSHADRAALPRRAPRPRRARRRARHRALGARILGMALDRARARARCHRRRARTGPAWRAARSPRRSWPS